MADFVFNIAKGKAAYYASRAGTGTEGLKVIVLGATNIEADATLQDYDTLAALLAGASDEVDNTGYARKTITSTTVTVDDTNNRTDADFADQTWTSVAADGTKGAWAKLIIVYCPDTSGADSTFIPLTAHDFSVTPNGGNITAQINAAGFYRAS